MRIREWSIVAGIMASAVFGFLALVEIAPGLFLVYDDAPNWKPEYEVAPPRTLSVTHKPDSSTRIEPLDLCQHGFRIGLLGERGWDRCGAE
jgi:hypothetical protein